MTTLDNNWISERSSLWPGRALSVEIKKHLFSKKSPFQQIDIYETFSLGKMLVLDGIIQLTESDEFAYQEMMTHIAMFSHPAPKKILVIGGGDGGILREIARHETVEVIDICEIDEDVINACKQFIPATACGFDDPRVTLHLGDGSTFIKKRQQFYDVIIVDSSDPIGPAKALFESPFYAGMKSALQKDGIIATQGESFFMHQDIVKNLATIMDNLFPIHAYAYVMVPTYPGGSIGICLGSTGPVLTKPNREVKENLLQQLKYYTPEIHTAAFSLPAFASRFLRN